jgi:hypothetical protein
MNFRNLAMAGVCLMIAAIAPRPVKAQCASTQDQAVQCFVSDAVKTKLLTVHFGMTAKQFQAYGVSVSKILQDQQTYMVLLGLTGAISDAMPATNANGTVNLAAQQAAISSIVSAAVSDGLITIPAETTQQDLVWLSEDLVTAMTGGNGSLLSPGTLLRVVDSYVVTATANGSVNWSNVNLSLANMISSLSATGLLKLPATITLTQADTFAESLAQTIYAYKRATARTTL